MADLVRVGTGGVCDRELFVLDVDRPADEPADLPFPSKYFACLLACDATAIGEEALTALVRRLLLAGCVYICCWGPGCEGAHDLFDAAELEERPEGPFAMSTWHSDESLAEAAWFLLFNSYPDDAFFDECRSAVALTIGSRAWAAEARRALSSPSEFSARLLGEAGPGTENGCELA